MDGGTEGRRVDERKGKRQAGGRTEETREYRLWIRCFPLILVQFLVPHLTSVEYLALHTEAGISSEHQEECPLVPTIKLQEMEG